ncbi:MULTISPECIES: helix-turn-helix domain-containing protein [unclassified Microbacterium]|uniref:winged helix-turn-helix transcriptional regulator n=1 Tax=unclassified Microbacterium TaxID=2609290 RepID=UPI00214CB177|nr:MULTISPECIES: helix-turn-helix domain-containing protein [unclassified Microbacterium]MCR2783200.1 helix-turn-helix transcriptional regulator [Microbacterium sp. zg.B96]WIM15921.1 helix-turn-helix domain-containing protein [Microbacterium sp. zg-B96]
MAARSYGQYCGLTTAVELIGERWALLIIRDLLVGPRRYTDLKQGLPRIPTNILSTRLKELQDAGVIRRVPLAHRGLVYEVTAYGRELEPIVLALGRWGFQAMGEPADGDVVTADSFTIALRSAFVADAAAALPPTTYDVHLGEVGVRAGVSAEGLRVAPLAAGGWAPAGEADVVLSAGFGIRRLISGELGPQQAQDAGVVEVRRGDPALLERFAATFSIPPGSMPRSGVEAGADQG